MMKPLMCVAVGVAVAMSATVVEAKPRKQAIRTASLAQDFTYGYNSNYVEYQSRQQVRRSAKRSSRKAKSRAPMTASRNCLVPAARALLNKIEAKFGPVQVISTCRPGAIIAGTRRPSLHRYGMAIDFKTNQKDAVVRWLAANNPGGTMTYARSKHIHADVGSYHFVSLAGRRYASARVQPTRTVRAAPAEERIAAVAVKQAAISPAAPQNRQRRMASRATRLAGVYAMQTTVRYLLPVGTRPDYHVLGSNTPFAFEPLARRRFAARQERAAQYAAL